MDFIKLLIQLIIVDLVVNMLKLVQINLHLQHVLQDIHWLIVFVLNVLKEHQLVHLLP